MAKTTNMTPCFHTKQNFVILSRSNFKRMERESSNILQEALEDDSLPLPCDKCGEDLRDSGNIMGYEPDDMMVECLCGEYYEVGTFKRCCH